MNKIVLSAINSKYVHTNLAIRKISAYLAQHNIFCEICEYSGNDEIMRVAADIACKKPDIAGFSCYIWNIDYTLKLAEILKKADKNIKIVLGGPEASYNKDKILQMHSFVDAIIIGEGEKAMLDIAKNGICDKIIVGENVDMDEMPFPYSETDFAQPDRIFYYESTRGCPFACSYCLSSADRHIKYKSLENVFADLDIFAKHNVRLVKFVDRTFNADEQRSIKILEYILTLDCRTEFHIELEAAIVSSKFIDVLKKFPPEKLRVEVGLQSSNPDTLHAVNRTPKTDVLGENVKKIITDTNVTLHLDLIAGLPLETVSIFKNSFDFAFDLCPHELQLGFLKVLPGTKIEKDAGKYGIEYASSAPYEVISTNHMSFDDISRLKNVEAALDMYHNSGILTNSEKLFLKHFGSAFEFFDALAGYLKNTGELNSAHHRTKLFGYICDFAKTLGICDYEFLITLAKDYFISCVGAPFPTWLEKGSIQLSKPKIHEVLLCDDVVCHLPFVGQTPSKDRHKHVRIENLFNMVWLISNKDKNIVDISKYFLLEN